jgi:hypothetical protein
MFPYNYLLLDAAKAEMNLYTAMELNPNYKSLYKGNAEEDLAAVSPYLFSIKENTPFADWYFKEGWNKSWGVLVFANVAFEDVYKHFRKFLMVKTEDGKQLYFRFYDPRVLRIFLPTCTEYQVKEIFGPVRHFVTESEKENEALQFWAENSMLRTKAINIAGMLQAKEAAVVTEQDGNTNVQSLTNDTTESDTTEEIKKSDAKRKWKFFLDE